MKFLPNDMCYSCRLILIAEKSTVYEKFPTPLINRLEKHFVLTSSILEDWQVNVLEKFQEWISKFSKAANEYVTAFCMQVSINNEMLS